MATNYVKFNRGSAVAFQNLVTKNNDTLYFITDSDDNKSQLYLGDKLIAGGITELNELNDIKIVEALKENQVLVFDNEKEKWINKNLIEAIGVMIGASDKTQGRLGLVPAPGIGQTNLFLRGDGIWASPTINNENIGIKTDEKTVSLLNDGITITLKDFGIKYYKYIPKSENTEAHYEVQFVDNEHPWKEDLEAKVTIDENNQFVLGWFEEDISINNKVETLTLKTEDLDILTKENENQINNINTSVKNISDLLNNKADISNTYTKNEVDKKILEAEHLIRKIFQTLEEAKDFATVISNPETYIYMVALETSENNKYAEYLYINGTLELVGSWDVNLDSYAKKEDIQIISSKVTNLEILLNSKVEKSEITTIQESLGTLNTKIINIEEYLNSDYFKSIEEIRDDLGMVKEAVIWKDLP